ncbi:hypothetical protein BSLG_000836 [Batrachochytrium salamandrivorans]|nr:hypothetical protein BSLG_000836 [Batrachochytrium salamandrivorans]
MASIVTDIAGRVVSTISAVGSFYTEINPSTLSGAIDVVVVEQESGELVCSPFHVRFGKLKLLRPSEKVVELSVNGVATNFVMKLGEAGEAFFVVESENPVPSEYATSPIPVAASSPEEIIEAFTLEPITASTAPPIDFPSTTVSPDASINHVQLDPVNVSSVYAPVSNLSLGIASQPVLKENSADGDPSQVMPKDSILPIYVTRSHPDTEPIELSGGQFPTLPETNAIGLSLSTTKDPRALLPKSLGTIAETQSLGLPIASTRTGESEVKSNDTLSNMQDRLSDGGIELDNSRTLSVSPSNGWSWSWGDLPEKRQEQTNWRKGVDPAVMTHKEDHGDLSARPVSPTHGGDSVRTRASVPILNSTYYSRIDRSSTPRLASQNVSENSHAPTMSVTEKVDQYLAGLPQATIPPASTPSVVFPTDSVGKANDDAQLVLLLKKLSLSSKSEETPDAIPTSSCPIPATNAIPRIEMSICGGIKNLRMMSSAAADVAFKKHMVSFESFNENTAMMMDPALVFRIHGFYLTWSTIAPLLLAHAVYGKPLSEEGLRKTISGSTAQNMSALALPTDAPRNTSSAGRWSWWGRGATSSLASASAPLLPLVQQDSKKLDVVLEKSTTSHDGNLGASGAVSEPMVSPGAHSSREKHRYAKSMRLTSTQLKSLNLKQGINTITFKVNSKLQGEAVCTSNLFLWHQNDKVIISDVDGTITKSDVLGHMFTMVGRDWTHAGVASLYTNICRNGYKFLYLTSRAIGQASYTRDYLKNVEQDRFQLPEGPVIMSPDRLLRAFHREVILRKPEEFKIACLRDIKRLFGESCPFYGGFGNRITDALSYRSVDVPQSRIFTIDPTGEIKLELMSNYKSSYIKLLDIVDQMFPPLSRSLLTEYMDWGFWRNELPEVKIDFSGASAPLKLIKHDSFDDITTDDVSDDGEGYEESNGEGSVQDDAHDYAMKEDVFEHADDSISGERGVGEVSNKKKPQRSLRSTKENQDPLDAELILARQESQFLADMEKLSWGAMTMSSIYSQINKTSTKACSAVANQSASCIKDPHCPSQFTWDQVRASSGATAASVKEVGYDASGAFEAFHGPKAAALLIKYHVGNLAPSEIIQPTAFLKEVHKLRTTIKQKGWEKASPLFYAWKLVTNFSILATSLFLLALYSRNFVALVVSSSLLALFWQQSGWLAHDFLHHQVFKTRAYNNAMGYFIGNVCQGFSVAWWKDKHCTHHSATNIHDRDPDIDTMPYLAWSEHALEGFAEIDDQQVAEFLVQNQPILYFPLLTFARVMWALQSFVWTTQPAAERTFPTLPMIERICLFIHYSWLFGSAFCFATPLRGFLWILLGQLFCGVFLASVFSLNHNGMPVYSTADAQKMEFYEISIRTGRNVEPTHFNNWFTGGLNYQIEHHMFPTVPRHNLHLVAPIVQDICKRNSIPYHSTGFMAGMGEVVGRLGSIARLAAKLQIQRAE